MSETKEWLKVSRATNGTLTVACTLVSGNHSVRWAVKTYVTTLGQGVTEARSGAEKTLSQLRASVGQSNAPGG